jgi:hypothetical protein
MLSTVQHTQPYSGTLRIFEFPSPCGLTRVTVQLYQVTLPLGNATFRASLLQAALHLHGSTTSAAQSTDAHPPSTPSSVLQLPCIHPYQPSEDVEITILFLESRCSAAATTLYHDRATARAAPNAPWLIPTMNNHWYPTANSHSQGTVSVVEGPRPLIPAPMRSPIATAVEAASPQGSLYDRGM